MNNNSFKKNILFSGGMILEVVLMVSIIMMIYPVINQQTIKRKTKLRDMLIVKEINTIKQVFERFLLKYIESFPKNTTCNINLSDMKSECKIGKITPPEGMNNTNELLNKVYSMGLPAGLGKGENMLGQKYSVRVRRKSIKKSNVDIVEAIVIASGNEDVEDITIRSIVRELGFLGGYLEGNAIVGMNWLDTSNWQYSKEEGQSDNFSDGSLINKLNPVKADKSLLVKYKTNNVIDNTMQTDILMNNKDIKRANLVDVKSGQYVYLKANDINIVGNNDVDFQIDDKITVNDGITYDNIDFDLGFMARNARLKINSNKEDSFRFSRDLIVEDSLYVTSKSIDKSPVMLTELNVEQIDSSRFPLDFQVNGVLKVKKIDATQNNSNIDNNNKLKINALYTSVLGIITPNASVTYDSVFANTKNPNASLIPQNSPISNPCTDCVLYLGENGTSNGKLSVFNDLVVSKLNEEIKGVKLGKYKKGSEKYDGVVVRYDTTLGEILRNLALEREMVKYYIDTYFSSNWGGF